MPRSKRKNSLRDMEKALHKAETTRQKYVLKLYVSGATARSSKAIENIRWLCEVYLKDCYKLEVIDIYQQPERLKREQVVAAPTLIKELPLPLRKLIGDLSDREKIIVGLDIKRKKDDRK